jgi:hypothetical protein
MKCALCRQELGDIIHVTYGSVKVSPGVSEAMVLHSECAERITQITTRLWMTNGASGAGRVGHCQICGRPEHEIEGAYYRECGGPEGAHICDACIRNLERLVLRKLSLPPELATDRPPPKLCGTCGHQRLLTYRGTGVEVLYCCKTPARTDAPDNFGCDDGWAPRRARKAGP